MKFPFNRGGYRHELVDQAGKVCLVRRVSTHRMSKGSEHWEVVILRPVEAHTFPDGRTVPACDGYPSPTGWGQHGWTYTALEDACRRFHEQASLQGAVPLAGGFGA